MANFYRFLVTVCAAVVLTPLAAMLFEPFFSEFLQLAGIDTSEWAGPVMSTLASFLSSPTYLWPALVLSGIAVGMWVDALLRKKDSTADNAKIEKKLLDREELADRADTLVTGLARLYGEWDPAHDQAWWDDTEDGTHRGSKSRAHIKDAKFVEKYADSYMAEAWSIFSLSQKFLVLDSNRLWSVSRGVGSSRDLHELVVFLSEVSADLRHDEPRLAPRNRLMRARGNKSDHGELGVTGDHPNVDPAP